MKSLLACRKKAIFVALCLAYVLVAVHAQTVIADDKVYSFDEEYSETRSDTSDYDSAISNLKTEDNCRVFITPSDGRMTISGTVHGYAYIYIYDQYGASELYDKCVNNGQYTVRVNVSKGEHYIKFIKNYITDTSNFTYTVSFTPNKIYTNSKKALRFNKYHTEYLSNCTISSALINEKTDTNCRKIVLTSDKRIKLSAYTLGASDSTVCVYIYKSDGQNVLSDWPVTNGKKTKTISLKKGTYYMKFHESVGTNAEFHYKLKIKQS